MLGERCRNTLKRSVSGAPLISLLLVPQANVSVSVLLLRKLTAALGAGEEFGPAVDVEQVSRQVPLLGEGLAA